MHSNSAKTNMETKDNNETSYVYQDSADGIFTSSSGQGETKRDNVQIINTYAMLLNIRIMKTDWIW